MNTIALCFLVDSPDRLRTYKYTDRGADYFDPPADGDDGLSSRQRFYETTNQSIGDLIRQSEGRFAVAFHFTGRMLELLSTQMTGALKSFKALLRTGQVELTGGPLHQSLACLHSREEFSTQVRLQVKTVRRLFGCRPLVMVNTGLIYRNDLIPLAAELGFHEVVCPINRPERMHRHPMKRYAARGKRRVRQLFADPPASRRLNVELSGRSEVRWPGNVARSNRNRNAAPPSHGARFMLADYDAISQNPDNGPGGMGFLARWVSQVLHDEHRSFQLPSAACAALHASEIDVPVAVDGFSPGKNLSLWTGNPIQSDAAEQLYALRDRVLTCNDVEVTRDWRRLTAENHFRDMCADASANRANPSISPYEAYIRFMNTLDDLRRRIG